MAQMVDIGDKPEVARRATARGWLRLRPATATAIAADRQPGETPFLNMTRCDDPAVDLPPRTIPLSKLDSMSREGLIRS